MICTSHQLLFGRLNREISGRACSTYGGEEWRIQGFGGQALGKETTSKTQA
jgi:hypothetical protein